MNQPPDATLTVLMSRPSFIGVSMGTGLPSIMNMNVSGLNPNDLIAEEMSPLEATSYLSMPIVITDVTSL